MFFLSMAGFYAPLEYLHGYLYFSCVIIVIVLYSFMFAARMLESAIEGKIVNRSDSLKTFFYIWFFPIGIWYIQPAVKRVLIQQEIHQ
jgi:hypothetical protein